MADVKKKSRQVVEIEFDSGKKVRMRAMEIRDLNIASQAAAKRSGDNQFVFQMSLQTELLKVLLESVDGHKMTGADLERLDDFLEPSEYMSLAREVQEIMGNAPVKARSFVS
jgi:hypothetical protein